MSRRYRAISPRQERVERRRAAAAAEPTDYRELQERAKAAGIPANQSREELEKALGDV